MGALPAAGAERLDLQADGDGAMRASSAERLLGSTARAWNWA